MRRPGPLATLAGLAAAFAVTACGSTVAPGPGGLAAGPAGGGLDAVGAPGTPTGGVDAAPGLQPVVTSGGPGSSGVAPVTPATTGGPSTQVPGGTTGPVSRAVAAPGVTATTVKIGYFYYEGSEAAVRSLGIEPPSFGDPAAPARATVAEVNRRGGMAGRKVELLLYGSPPTTSKSFDQQAQEICEHFTKDVKVFALAPVNNATMRACLQQRGVLALSTNVLALDEQDFRAAPFLIDTLSFTTGRAMSNLVDALGRSDYFTTSWNTVLGRAGGTSPVTIGVIHSDEPHWQRAVKGTLLPGLAARGRAVDPDNVFEYHKNTSADEAQQTITQIQSAVLKFRSNDVTHVIAPDNNGMGFFSLGAEQQEYRPRYAVSTASSPQLGYQSNQMSNEQLSGAVGYAWLPSVDLRPEESGPYTGPGQAACLKAMRADGVQPQPGTETAAANAMCDLFFILQRAVDASASLDRAGVVRALEAITSYPFAALTRGGFGPGRRYPVTVGWLSRWDTDCRCLRYASPAYTLR